VGHILLTDDAVNTDRLVSRIASTEFGAVVTFLGNVRDNSRGRRVHYLEYEAYRPLAEKQLAAIVAAAEERWNAVCGIEHRLGRVEIGQTSVIIAVASPHRVDAFEACRWLMDTLKESVPIWKKEYFETGVHWVEGSDTVPAASQQ
jgi:molybdopterin synthase catalytic subunit